MIFTTERLLITEFEEKDKGFFIELLSAPEIIDPIPQPKWSIETIQDKFNTFTQYPQDPKLAEKVAWGVFEKDKPELIGLCALLTNDENQREIAYRFRKKYWGKGYGTEVARHMIHYCFTQLGLGLLTADVNIENVGSASILEKFFKPVKEFFNESDQCTDRRYVLTRESWLHQNQDAGRRFP